MGHIRDRGKDRPLRWQARYTGDDGREHTEAFARKEDARRFLTANEHRLDAGEWLDPTLGLIRFARYADEWLATKAGVGARTRINVEGRIRNYATPHFGKMRVAAVRPMHTRAFVADLANQGLAPATIKAVVLTTGQVFAQAVADGLIARSPFANVELPPERHHEEVHFLDADQVNDLAGAIDERYRTAIYVAAYGGLRAGELWALRLAPSTCSRPRSTSSSP